ncbi:MAG: hypothetical protein R3C30_12410 [Hyphomonadaceae bacterium]
MAQVRRRGTTMDVQRLFESPDFYHFSFDRDDALFAEMDRSTYRRSIFLDRRIAPKGTKVHRAKLSALYEQLGSAPQANIGIIFHVAHCGSTLLARALDVENANLVCREPMTLRQLGVEATAWRGAGAPPEEWTRRLQLTAALLNRRYNSAGPVIVKANVPVNFMIPELMALNAGPAILLYATLEEYLLAILRSADHQAWVERVTGELGAGIEGTLGGFDKGQGLAKTAAQLWLAQMLIFDDTMRRFPSVVSLDAEVFFSQPQHVIGAAFKHFGQAVSDQEVGVIVEGELFSRYSKNPQLTFSNAERLALREQIRAELGTEIAAAREWVAKLPAFARLSHTFAKPLAGDGLIWR